jgi:glutathione peroxidase
MSSSTTARVFTALALCLTLASAAPAETEGSALHKPASLLDLEAPRLGGETESLGRYRGEVLLVVNTASRCGYTPQYEGLQALYARYRERGFSVLGFPSNDFAGQEPGSDLQILEFCRSNYGVEFPMFSKIHVKGEDAHPVYRYLTALPDPVGGPVEWNFQKYLVDRSGEVVERFSPSVAPEDERLVGAIEKLLAAPPPSSGEPKAGG